MMDRSLLDTYPEIMSIAQVSEALHIGRSSTYKLISNNTIGHLRIGATIRIPKSCLIEYVATAWNTTENARS